jgi:hypothetical protein
VTVKVTHTNRHASADEGNTVTYKLTDARVRLHVSYINNDGSVGSDDAVAGDAVHLIGKIRTLARHCYQTGFTPETAISKLIVSSHTKG